jgi:REP element-mobilizing transposase RayT
MRTARIKVAATEGEAVYHVMSRVVNGEWWFAERDREVLRKQLWQIADYCGVVILTYAILSNHFHVLVRVPRFTAVSDTELLRRYAVLYPKPTRFQQARIEVIKQHLETGAPEGVRWRNQQLRLMYDISSFMRLVKQRFSIAFNKSHHRYGTLWAERFKSVLVEPQGRTIETMAAYIDLNCVRAGLARDPKDYRFCGYAEAVGGSPQARAGLRSVIGGRGWSECQAVYRQILFGTGSEPREGEQRITEEQFAEVIRTGGKLPLADVLRCRVRYFTDGAVLGSREFVTHHLARYREKTGRRREKDVHDVPTLTEWGAMSALRALRRSPFG